MPSHLPFRAQAVESLTDKAFDVLVKQKIPFTRGREISWAIRDQRTEDKKLFLHEKFIPSNETSDQRTASNGHAAFFLKSGFAIGVLLATLAPNLASADWQGRVVWVFDGDSIRVAREKKVITVRVAGIDAPEKGQPFANQARAFTFKLALKKTVTVREKENDRYGRTVAQIFLPDGRSLSQALVRAGLAWWYRRYSQDQTLMMLEKKAKKAGIGLWSDPDPVPPWVWKRHHKRRSRQRGHSSGLGGLELAVYCCYPSRPWPQGWRVS